MKRSLSKTNLTASLTAVSLTAILLIVAMQPAGAQNGRYQQAMEKNVAVLDTTHSAAGFQTLGNTFNRIAEAEKDKWLPYYYAAYSQVMQAFMDQKDKDMMQEKADEAEKLITKADELSPDNAEIRCIQSMILSARISVNPAIYGAVYGPKSGELLQEAMQLAPDNPRPHLLMGQSLFYTPAMFGGGKEKAKPFLESAREKFNSFQPESPIHPHWGKELLEQLLKQVDE